MDPCAAGVPVALAVCAATRRDIERDCTSRATSSYSELWARYSVQSYPAPCIVIGKEAGRLGGREAGRQGGRDAGTQGHSEAGKKRVKLAGKQGGSPRQGGREAARHGDREAGR